MFDKKYILPTDALELILKSVSGPLSSETVGIEDCAGRISAEDIYSSEDLPGFARSSVDGFAVRSADAYGAKENLPAYMISTNEVFMGQAPLFEVNKGEAAKIPTGGMLPAGADAVVMIENVQVSTGSMIEILKPVAMGENVIQADEDVKKGSLIIYNGRRLRPQDAGALAGLGFTRVAVVRMPVVSLISTGDEIVSNGSIKPGQVRDINSFTLAGLISEEGGIALKRGIFKDDYTLIRNALLSAVQGSDIVLIIGGTSVGTRDMTAKIIAEAGPSELLFNGVAIKPGRPLICGIVDSKPVFGLPGHPAAVAICFDMFIRPVMNKLRGIDTGKVFPKTLTATMAKAVASAAGREDHVRVCIETGGDNGYVAVPVLGKSGLIMTLVRADGVVVISENKLGLDAGETVEVNLF
jgi:molybdopterin molybdotransferase